MRGNRWSSHPASPLACRDFNELVPEKRVHVGRAGPDRVSLWPYPVQDSTESKEIIGRIDHLPRAMRVVPQKVDEVILHEILRDTRADASIPAGQLPIDNFNGREFDRKPARSDLIQKSANRI